MFKHLLKIVTIFSIGLLFSECKSFPSRGEKYPDRYLYLKTSSGQCIQIDTEISVSGSETFQSGILNIRIIPEGEPCA